MRPYFIVMLLLLGTIQFAQAQCRTFVKNNCKEAMSGYLPNENFNSAKLMPGDEAEVQMSMFGGNDYRILICSQALLQGISFQVTDAAGNELYNNATDQSDHFDFRLENAQELIVKLQVPKQKGSQISPQGCVTVIVGKKIS